MWTRSVPPAGALSAIQPALGPSSAQERGLSAAVVPCRQHHWNGRWQGRLKSRADELAARSAESAVSPLRPGERCGPFAVRQSANVHASDGSGASDESRQRLPWSRAALEPAAQISQLELISGRIAIDDSRTRSPTRRFCACASATTCPTTARRRARRRPRRTRRPASTRSAAARRCAPRPRRFYRSGPQVYRTT